MTLRNYSVNKGFFKVYWRLLTGCFLGKENKWDGVNRITVAKGEL